MKHYIWKGIHTLWMMIAMAMTIAMPIPFSTSVLWAEGGFDAITFKPASDHGFYLTVQQSQTLKQGGHSLGITEEYSSNSFILKNTDGSTLQDVIGKQISLDLGGALGLFDWLDVGVTVTGVPFQKFVTPGTLVDADGARMGDILINLKAKILNNEKYPMGIAFVPFMSIPTGNSYRFTGNGKVMGGGMIVVDTKRFNDKVSFALNIGSQFREKIALTPSDRSFGNQFIYGASMNVALSQPVQVIAEANGWTPYNNFFKPNNHNLEFNGGLRFLFGELAPMALTVGGGTGVMRDNPGSPGWRVFTTLSYRKTKVENKPQALLPEPFLADSEKHTKSLVDLHDRFSL